MVKPNNRKYAGVHINNFKPKSKQQGVALVVTLIMLIVLSLLGVTSMRNSLFQQRMSVNSQLSVLGFQAAETAISGVLDEAENDALNTGNVILDVFDNATHVRCVTHSGTEKTTADCHGKYLDGLNGTVSASSTTKLSGKDPEAVVDDTILEWIFVETEGVGEVISGGSTLSKVTNTQDFAMKVPKASNSNVYNTSDL